MLEFLSTSSARRTTDGGGQLYRETEFLSTSSARRTTHCVVDDHRPSSISIHVLREEDDDVLIVIERRPCDISIHVLREEDDAGMIDQVTMDLYFYPRPPRGGRRDKAVFERSAHRISIHVLREEDDRRPSRASSDFLIFLSTSSARRTT